MNKVQLPADTSSVQAAIYQVALSLDSFLVNGIQYGMLQQVASDGFLQKQADILLSDLDNLEEKDSQASAAGESRVPELLASLRAACQRLVDLVRGLSAFRTLPLEQLQSMVSQIPPFREACVQLIQELEAHFRVLRPFYQSRPAHSTAALNGFLANLGSAFTQEWSTPGGHANR